MFAVVQHEEKTSCAQGLLEGGEYSPARLFPDPQHVCNGLRNKFRVGKRCQLYQPHSVGEFLKNFRRDLESQASFADTACSGQSQQTRGEDCLNEFSDFLVSPDKTSQLEWKVVGQNTQRPQGWELSREIRSHNLEKALRLG